MNKKDIDIAEEIIRKNKMMPNDDSITTYPIQIASLKDLNKQYFKNIIALEKRKIELGFLCVVEFIIIITILMVMLL